jgi:hypothetical protein
MKKRGRDQDSQVAAKSSFAKIEIPTQVPTKK